MPLFRSRKPQLPESNYQTTPYAVDQEVIEMREQARLGKLESFDLITELRPHLRRLESIIEHNHFGQGIKEAWEPIITAEILGKTK